MLVCSGIYKSFGDVNVLNGVDIEVQGGQIVSIIGPSGAGKSTLLQIAGTLMPADKGDVFINNTNVCKLDSNKLAEFRNSTIGFVFQFHHLLNEFSALENVIIPALIKGVKKNVALDRAKQLLEIVGMNHRLNHKPSQLSGGEAQRVAMARALINSPKIVFADEPSGNLDSKNKEELHNLIFDIRNELNTTFLIVTHDNEFVKQSDKIITIKDGFICK